MSDHDETANFIVVNTDAPATPEPAPAPSESATPSDNAGNEPPNTTEPDKAEPNSDDEPSSQSEDSQEPGEGDQTKPDDDAADARKPRRSAQKRINKAIAQKSQAESKAAKLAAENEQLRAELEALKQPSPVEGDFEDYADFVRAKDAHDKSQQDAKDAIAKSKETADSAVPVEVQTAIDIIGSAVEAAENLPEDFKELVYAEDLTLTQDMLKSISATDTPTELLYELASNRDKAEAIANMGAAEQMRAIFQMEAEAKRVPPKPKQHSNAPEPITPVSTNTEPPRKTVAEMSFSEYEKHMNAKGAGRSIF